jgi:excisionase family DNA binding protein
MSAQNRGKVEDLLTPGEVATLFRVNPKTVTRWAKAGLLSCIKTPGGHRRYLQREIEDLAQQRFEQPVAGKD